MKFFLLEVVLPLLVLLFLRNILRSVFDAFRSGISPNVPDRTRPAAAPVAMGGDLKKDPVCGTYVSPVGSVSRKVNGQLIYFCSAECRDKYRAA